MLFRNHTRAQKRQGGLSRGVSGKFSLFIELGASKMTKICNDRGVCMCMVLEIEGWTVENMARNSALGRIDEHLM